MKRKNRKPCFTCDKCCTMDCPNIQYDAVDERWGYGIADDCGLERIDCKDCAYNSGLCVDCMFQNDKECPEVTKNADN